MVTRIPMVAGALGTVPLGPEKDTKGIEIQKQNQDHLDNITIKVS